MDTSTPRHAPADRTIVHPWERAGLGQYPYRYVGDRLAGPHRGEVSIDFIVTGDGVQTVVRCDQPLKPGRYTARASLKVRP